MIEEYSQTDNLVRNWRTDNRYMSQFDLSFATKKIKLSVCLDQHKNFTIGKIELSFFFHYLVVLVFRLWEESQQFDHLFILC